MALPEVTERPSHSAPTWFVRDKQSFVMLWEHGHHNNDFPHLWCAAPRARSRSWSRLSPSASSDRPTSAAAAGWVLRLDVAVDWHEIAGICEEAYRVVAPKRLVAVLDRTDP